jgi:hypothetical protein
MEKGTDLFAHDMPKPAYRVQINLSPIYSKYFEYSAGIAGSERISRLR